MSFPNSSFPLPMYAIDNAFQIISLNQAAINALTSGSSFLDIIEPESRPKVESHLRQFAAIESLEVNILSSSGAILLVDLYVSWTEEGIGEIIVVQKDSAIRKVSEQLSRLRARLTETNFELLREKELAESLLHENVKLSSPFIEITDTVALIPIFGELDVEKSEMIASTLTQRAYQSEVESVIIDFTAAGRIRQDGLSGFQKLVHVLGLFGLNVIVTGLHPTHVKEWNALEFTADIRFMKSLRSAIQDITAHTGYRKK